LVKALVFLCSLSACGNTITSDTSLDNGAPQARAGAPNQPNGEASAASFIGEFCRYATVCCGSSAGAKDEVACRNAWGAKNSPSFFFDVKKAEACLARLRAFADPEGRCGKPWAASPCAEVFQTKGGRLQPGDLCDLSALDPAAQCASAPGGLTACAPRTPEDVSSKVARCLVFLPGALEEPCAASLVPTAPGPVCGMSPLLMRDSSSPLLLTSKFCDTREGLFCDRQRGVCVLLEPLLVPRPGGSKPIPLGQECSAPEYCPDTSVCTENTYCASICEGGAVCDGLSRRCILRLANGQTCFTGSQCHSLVCAGGICEGTVEGVSLTDICSAIPQ